MDSSFLFKGLGVALITPFKTDGSVDFDALRSLVDWHIRSRVDYLCILGTTAETPCLTLEEKQHIRETVVRQVRGRVPILLGCGGNCTAHVIDELQHLPTEGIQGILSVCPMYNKPTQEGLYQHYRAISQASPLPIVLYNVPGRTGVNLNAETTLRLAHDLPNIIAIKEASGKMDQIREILANRPQGFHVISGDDSLTLQIMLAGGDGVISVIANVIPATVAQMVHLMQEGRLAEARIIADQLFELCSLMFIEGNPSGVKAALNELCQLSPMGLTPIQNILRLPLVPVSQRTEQRIAELLRQLAEM